MSHRAVRIAAFIALSFAARALAPVSSHAQPAADAGAPEPPALEPVLVAPRLLEFSEAAYPGEALARGQSALVVLQLDIDAEGRVTAAEVVDPAGHGFDEAARDAALRFRFAPALKDGHPVPSRIRYRYSFDAPPPTAPQAPVAAPPPLAPTPLPGAPVPREPAEATAAAEPVQVTVTGLSSAERLQRSAEAVTVLDTERARRQSADLGEVMRRTRGVGVRRSGGLGTSSRLSLDGMTDDQIRFFLDGVPLEFAGFLDVSTVPVSAIERVEMYRGVVPVRFGTDALGGAINLVGDSGYRGTRASASYQGGSFGTNRAAAQVRHRFEGTPFVASAAAFYDSADNDYPVDVEVPNELGQLRPARVYRFHDAYRAFGASLEAGLINAAWARRLLIRLYANDFSKEQQHNQVMTVPYGEVEAREWARGASLRYELPLDLLADLDVSLLVAYARRGIEFVDDSRFVYDWFGQRIRERVEPGEVGAPQDSEYAEHRTLLRLGASYVLAPEHELRLAATLTHASRRGRNALYAGERYLDPASAQQGLLTLVSGLEYELSGWGDRLENVTFIKHYYYQLSAEIGLDFGRAPVEEGFAEVGSASGEVGFGNVARLRIADWVLAKASYERAVRLPPAEQVFGDGRLTLSNYELEPEASHNANLGLALTDARLAGHALRAELYGFLRGADQLIQALTVDNDYRRYYNIWSASALGAGAALGWSSPGELLSLDANTTWIELRNTSRRGPFADFEGDRIPNRPWLYANASAALRLSGVSAPSDELTLTWHTNYVHEFFRSWESAGRRDYKLSIDAQLLHSAALTYLVSGPRTFSATFEVQNLSDERTYDFLGVQKPGRAYYFKGVIEL